MKRKKIPKFKNHKEEAKFWDSVDSTEFLEELQPAQLTFPKSRKKLVSIRLPEAEIAALKRLAARKGVGYLTLIRMWVTERFFEEIRETKDAA